MRHPKGCLAFLFWLSFWCKNTQLPQQFLDLLGNQVRSPESRLFLLIMMDDSNFSLCFSFKKYSSPFKITVPSSVSGVTVNNSGRNDYLSVSWLPAPGDVDSYVVTLSHESKVVQFLVIAKSVSECSFSSLTPGRLYNVTITTRSGKYENHSFSQERTGKSVRRFRLYKNQGLCGSGHHTPATILQW